MTPIPVTVVHDPNGLFDGGSFTSQDFNVSLRTGAWPPGMHIERDSHRYVIKAFTEPFRKFGWQYVQYRQTWALVNGHSMLIPSAHNGGASLEEIGRWIESS